MAFQHTHKPQFAGQDFSNTTIRGAFGDALAELDWGVGQVIQALKDANIENDTFVFFSSDNGYHSIIFVFDYWKHKPSNINLVLIFVGLPSIKKYLEVMLGSCAVAKVQLGREDRECLVLLVGRGK